MERLSLMMVVCLLAGLSDCQTRGAETEVTELTHEHPNDTWVEKDALQNPIQELETPATLKKNSTTSQLTCEPPIYTVLKELGALEERLTATVRALEETNKKLEASERKLSALDNKVTELGTVDQGQNRVAFSAAHPVQGTIGPVNVNHGLVYDNVLSNIGGHYSPVTGYFTAPVRGVYYFTFTSFNWANNGASGGSLYRNGNHIVSWYASTQTKAIPGSNSAILQLHVGDKVNVRLWANYKISDNGSRYCSFSGFLIFPV